MTTLDSNARSGVASVGMRSPAPVADVATALHITIGAATHWREPKVHVLLYYCQGHQLATFGEPLFPERIVAADTGPVVDGYRHEETRGAVEFPGTLTNGQLNTIGYVNSRYGGLTREDLQRLARAEDPWQQANLARLDGRSPVIDHSSIRTYFSKGGPGENDALEGITIPEEFLVRMRTAAEASIRDREINGPGKPDDLDAMRAKLERLRAEAGA